MQLLEMIEDELKYCIDISESVIKAFNHYQNVNNEVLSTIHHVLKCEPMSMMHQK